MNVLQLVTKDIMPIQQQENVYHVLKMDVQHVLPIPLVLNVSNQTGTYTRKIVMKFVHQEPMVPMENVLLVMMNV
jgi:hypothetical protein